MSLEKSLIFRDLVDKIVQNVGKLDDIAHFQTYWQYLEYSLKQLGFNVISRYLLNSVGPISTTSSEEKIVECVLLATLSAKYSLIHEANRKDTPEYASIRTLMDLRERSKLELNKISFKLREKLNSIVLISRSPEHKKKFANSFEKVYQKAVNYSLDQVITYDIVLKAAYNNLLNDSFYEEDILKFEHEHGISIKYFENGLEREVQTYQAFIDVYNMVEIIRTK